jgi:hypothetical protein
LRFFAERAALTALGLVQAPARKTRIRALQLTNIDAIAVHAAVEPAPSPDVDRPAKRRANRKVSLHARDFSPFSAYGACRLPRFKRCLLMA